MSCAAIYVPDFLVAALVRLEPALQGKPVAVLEGKPPVITVAALNEAAAEAGVELEMTKLQAAAYPVELRQRSSAQEASAHAALLDCAQAFSPRVEDTAPDTVVLDIAGLERLFGQPARLAESLVQRASEVGVQANVAVAANPDAAIHAARGFAGVTVIPPGKQAERLGALPIDVLQVTPEILETLDRWGVRNLRALAALPKVAIVERLGQEGFRLQELARGAVERPLVPAEPPLKFEESMELEYPVALLEPLAFILGRLMEQLCVRLQARALATNELRLTLGVDVTEGSQEVSRSSFLVSRENQASAEKRETRNEKLYRLRLPLAMLDLRLFLKLLQLDLRAHPPVAPVVKVTLAAEPAQPRPGQEGLFLPASPPPDRLELTLARLAGIVGGQRVGAAEVLDTHRPDAFQMKQFAPSAPQGLKPVNEKDVGAAQLKNVRGNCFSNERVADTGRKSSPEGGICVSPSRQRRVNCNERVSPAGATPILTHTPKPPLATALIPQRLKPDDCSRANAGLKACSTPAAMALRRFRPPLAATVELRDEEPVRIAADEIRGEIASVSGPWRSSGDWWNAKTPRINTDKHGSSWAREEWDVAIRNQGGVILYRIYRELASGAWFVEGSYD